jgi:uncharacterized protein RhaS with RHS repeats
MFFGPLQRIGLHLNCVRDYDPATGGYDELDPIGLYGGFLDQAAAAR